MVIFINLSGPLSKVASDLASLNVPRAQVPVTDEKGRHLVDDQGRPRYRDGDALVDEKLFARAIAFTRAELAAFDAAKVRWVGVCGSVRANVDGGRELLVSISEHLLDPAAG